MFVMKSWIYSKTSLVALFPNFNGATIEVREWMNNFSQQFTEHVDSLSMLWLKFIHANKRGRRRS